MRYDIISGQVQSPFISSSGEINVQALCKGLDIDRAMLPGAIGVKRQTIAAYFDQEDLFIKLRKAETREFFTKLNMVYVLVQSVMGKKAKKKDIMKWFHSPNKALKMKSPWDLVLEKQVDLLIKKLMDVATAAQGR